MVQSNTISKTEDFSTSLIAPWVKGNMSVDDSFLRIKMQNTIFFGLIPAGMTKDTSPLNTISNVYTSKEYKIGRILIGVLIAIASLSALGSSFIGALIGILIGIAITGSGILTTFAYEKSGVEKKIFLPFFEANHAAEFEEQVIAEIEKYQTDRNGKINAQSINQSAQANTDRIVESLNNK